MYYKNIGTKHKVDLDKVISVREFSPNDYLEQREHFANFSSVDIPKSVITMADGTEFVSSNLFKTVSEALNKRQLHFERMSRMYLQ